MVSSVNLSQIDLNSSQTSQIYALLEMDIWIYKGNRIVKLLNLLMKETRWFKLMSHKSFQFCPLTTHQMKTLCVKLNVVHVSNTYEPTRDEWTMSHWGYCKWWNCFFRSLSYAISATGNNHRKIWLTVVKNLEKSPTTFASYFWDNYSPVLDYVKELQIKYIGIWTTKVEIHTVSNTNLYL